MTNEDKIDELADIIYSKCGVSIRNCDSQTIAKKLIELNYGDTKQTALDFYTAVSLALADGVSAYIIDGKRVIAIKADDMQAYFDEIAKSYGVEIKK